MSSIPWQSILSLSSQYRWTSTRPRILFHLSDELNGGGSLRRHNRPSRAGSVLRCEACSMGARQVHPSQRTRQPTPGAAGSGSFAAVSKCNKSSPRIGRCSVTRFASFRRCDPRDCASSIQNESMIIATEPSRPVLPQEIIRPTEHGNSIARV